jgi:drug/metabolite transporter (DMT)-like permease
MEHSLKTWLIPAFICCFATAMVVISIKNVGNNFILDSLKISNKRRILLLCSWSILVIVGIIGILCLLSTSMITSFTEDIKYVKDKIINKPSLIFFLLLVAFFIWVTQLSMFYSVNFCPNMGYAHLVINLNVIITLIVGYLFFGGHISMISSLGVIISLIGISLVIYGSSI